MISSSKKRFSAALFVAASLVGLAQSAPASADDCQSAYKQCVAAGGGAACSGVLSGCSDAKSGKLERQAKSGKKAAMTGASNTGAVLELGLEGKEKVKDFEVKHTCDGELELDGEAVKSAKGVGIMAGQGCKLTLNKVKIKAKRGIVVEGNAQIILKDSSIDASDVAISVEGNAQIVLLGKSVVKGKKFSIVSDDDANVMVNAVKSAKIKGKLKLSGNSVVNKDYTP